MKIPRIIRRSRVAARTRIQPQRATPDELPIWVIGHRGLSSEAPENTLSSFRRAIEAGVNMIELDVTLTRDRVPVVIHDRRVDRTTNGRGVVRRLTYDAVRRFDAGNWFSGDYVAEWVPTFDEVLDLCAGRVALNIEIKLEAVTTRLQGGIEEKVIEAVEKRGLRQTVVISSFLALAVRRIKVLSPQQPTAFLLSRPLRRDPRRVAERAYADALHLPLRGLTREAVALASREGLPVRVYTVNEAADMKRLLTWGVDGMFTDFSRRLLSVVRS